jgi:MFS family permease
MKNSQSFARAVYRGTLSPIVDSLRTFKGNARTCIIVEPMWGIPNYLFMPYASLYMLALGVSETGIGVIATVGMALQTVWSLVGGWITDRFGRKRTSLVFDLISWSVPTLLWAFAQDIRWFFAAAVLNSAVRVVHISWSCLFIEDAPPDTRVRLYTWISVAGTLAGLFAPLAGLFVVQFGLVPATRGLYLFAFVSMTAMFFIRNAFCTETSVGREKMAASRGANHHDALKEYRAAAASLFGNRETTIAFLLAVLSNIHLQTRNSFLSVVMTRGIGLSEGFIAVFPPLASAVTLAVYLLVIPRIVRIRSALALSLIVNVAGNLILFFAPAAAASSTAAIVAVVLGTLAAAIGMGVTGPVVDAVLANSVDEKKRAVILSIVYTLMYGISAPFGWIAGAMAEIDPRLPALLAAAAMIVAAALAMGLKKGGGRAVA